MAPPNIIFILMDDSGWADLGCYGSSFYETPNLDRLAQRGLRFSNAYAACPVCSPTRASIMSGKYPARVGVTNYLGGNARGRVIDAPFTRHLPLEETSLAQALREGGYTTWHVGKRHLGEEPYWPERHGFDVNIGGCSMGSPRHGYFSPWRIPTLPDAELPEGTYLPDHLTDEAIRLIRANRNSGKPFFRSFRLFRGIFHWLLRTSPVSEEIRVYEYVYEYGSIRKSYSHSFHPRAPRSASGGIGGSESASMNWANASPLNTEKTNASCAGGSSPIRRTRRWCRAWTTTSAACSRARSRRHRRQHGPHLHERQRRSGHV